MVYNSSNGVVILIVILVIIAAGLFAFLSLWLGGDK